MNARSVYRPSQYRLSAFDAVTSDSECRFECGMRFTEATDSSRCLSVLPSSGASTHVSLNPPPCDELTIIWPGTDE